MSVRRDRSERYASLPGGATLYYTDEGEGAPLLFVHAWTGDSNDYLWQLARFRGAHRVIAPDLRGHGRSPAALGGYDARVLARDLIELMDHLEVERCVAVGHSLGGLVVSALAVEYPDRILGLVCLDPAYGVGDAGMAACRAMVADMDRTGGRERLAAAFGEWEGASTPDYFRELHRRRMLAMDWAVVADSYADTFAGPAPLASRARSADYFAGRVCPVLAIYSLAGPERAEWERTQARHPASRALHLPLGHWLHQDEPQAINALVGAWLADLPR